MTIKQIIAGTVFVASLAGSGASAWDQYPFDMYLQRKDTVTLDAGNAKAANTVTHMIHPWPPYAFDRRIPAEGERMARAVERYRDVAKIPGVPCPIVPQYDAGGLKSGGSGAVSGQCGSANIGAVGGTATNTTGVTGGPGGTATTNITSTTFPVIGR